MRDPASTFGPYDLLEPLGRGGMGVVFKARRRSDGHEVALKLLPPHPVAGAAARLRREAEAASRIRHPNVASVLDAGEHEGRLYVALELIPGRTLADALAAGPLGVSRALELVAKVARAIEAAHEQGVVHRDLKPSNIIIADRGEPVVIDFGLAKAEGSRESLTRTGEVLGTLFYMSPEQLEGRRDVDARTDVYALGAILFECLTGRPPFDAATSYELMVQVANEAPAPPSRLAPGLSPAVDAIVLRALSKDRDARHETASALATDLERVLGGAHAAGGRGWGSVVVLVTVVLLVAGAGAAALLLRRDGPPPPVVVAPPPPPPPKPKPARGPSGWDMLAKAAGAVSLAELDRMPVEEGTAYLMARKDDLDAAFAALEDEREAELRPVVAGLVPAFSVELYGKEPHAKASPGLTIVEGGWGLRPEYGAFALRRAGSYLRLHFDLTKKPTRAVLRLAGCATGNDRGLDFSPVDVTANGDAIALAWNPGFGRNDVTYKGAGAAFDVTRFLRTGTNDVDVRLTRVARTQFWIRRVEVLLGE
jgi:predicted Ser/Thr protein kinase